MPDDNPAANLYHRAAELLGAHERMLSDSNRNRPFYRALKKNVTPDSVVLDVGAGSGVWAIVAARLGAKRVVAVEHDGLLIGLIKALARDNGVADRVEVVAGNSQQVALGKDFDVVVSETIGHLGFEEEIIPIMIDARERFLKPGGVLIPDSVTLRVAAAHFEGRSSRLPAEVHVNYDLFESLTLHAPLALAGQGRLKTLGAPQDLTHVDLTGAAGSPDFADMTARWAGLDTRGLNCFAVWAEATLSAGVRLTTARTSSWHTTGYRVEPFRGERGDLEFKLTFTSEAAYWTATLVGDQGEEVQSYSPALAAAALLASTRTDADVFGRFRRGK